MGPAAFRQSGATLGHEVIKTPHSCVFRYRRICRSGAAGKGHKAGQTAILMLFLFHVVSSTYSLAYISDPFVMCNSFQRLKSPLIPRNAVISRPSSKNYATKLQTFLHTGISRAVKNNRRAGAEPFVHVGSFMSMGIIGYESSLVWARSICWQVILYQLSQGAITTNKSDYTLSAPANLGDEFPLSGCVMWPTFLPIAEKIFVKSRVCLLIIFRDICHSQWVTQPTLWLQNCLNTTL